MPLKDFLLNKSGFVSFLSSHSGFLWLCSCGGGWISVSCKNGSYFYRLLRFHWYCGNNTSFEVLCTPARRHILVGVSPLGCYQPLNDLSWIHCFINGFQISLYFTYSFSLISRNTYIEKKFLHESFDYSKMYFIKGRLCFLIS